MNDCYGIIRIYRIAIEFERVMKVECQYPFILLSFNNRENLMVQSNKIFVDNLQNKTLKVQRTEIPLLKKESCLSRPRLTHINNINSLIFFGTEDKGVLIRFIFQIILLDNKCNNYTISSFIFEVSKIQLCFTDY